MINMLILFSIIITCFLLPACSYINYDQYHAKKNNYFSELYEARTDIEQKTKNLVGREKLQIKTVFGDPYEILFNAVKYDRETGTTLVYDEEWKYRFNSSQKLGNADKIFVSLYLKDGVVKVFKVF